MSLGVDLVTASRDSNFSRKNCLCYKNLLRSDVRLLLMLIGLLKVVPLSALLVKSIEVLSAVEGDFNNCNSKYFIIPAGSPAKGILFVTYDNPEFISGHVWLRGKDQVSILVSPFLLYFSNFFKCFFLLT